MTTSEVVPPGECSLNCYFIIVQTFRSTKVIAIGYVCSCCEPLNWNNLLTKIDGYCRQLDYPAPSRNLSVIISFNTEVNIISRRDLHTNWGEVGGLLVYFGISTCTLNFVIILPNLNVKLLECSHKENRAKMRKWMTFTLQLRATRRVIGSTWYWQPIRAADTNIYLRMETKTTFLTILWN